MNRLTALLIVLVSGVAHAESYLCVPEAGASVMHGGGEPIRARIEDDSDNKFIVTNNSGQWLVKLLGRDEAVYECSSPNYCEGSKAYVGTFIRYTDGVFSATWLASDKQGHQFLTAVKGRCSKI